MVKPFLLKVWERGEQRELGRFATAEEAAFASAASGGIGLGTPRTEGRRQLHFTFTTRTKNS